MSEVLKQKIRKDLSRWSRKLLLCIGLENIGKHLVGDEKWQSLYPAWQNSEQDGPTDFDPTEVAEQDITSAELSHIDPSDTPEEETNEEKNDFLENFFHLLPYWYFINRAFGVPGIGLGGGSVSEEDLTNSTANPLLEAFDAQRLNSLLFLESLKQQLHVQNFQSGNTQGLENPFSQVQNFALLSADTLEAAKKAAAARLTADPKYADALPLTLPGLSATITNHEDHDQPLDLTQKNRRLDGARETRKHWSALENTEVSSSSVRGMKIPETRTNKLGPRPNQRAGRGYTTQELEAALRDIQSGKLGTRRAAVIYGIPRSTLRNKVYKMGKDRSRPYFRQRTAGKCMGDIDELPSAETLSPKDVNARNHALNFAFGDVIQKSGNANASELTLPHTGFPAIPSSHSQGGLFESHRSEAAHSEEDETSKVEEDISHEKKVLKEWLRTKLSRQTIQQQSADNERLNSATRTLSSLEQLSDSSDNSDGSRHDLRKDVILKIPSLLNNKSSLSRVISRKKLKRRPPKDEDTDNQSYSSQPANSVGEPTSTITTAEDVVEDSSWQQSKNDDFGNVSMDEMEVESKCLVPVLSRNHEKKSYEDSREPAACGSGQGFSSGASGPSVSDTNGKKSRPKRGKYRNYDRDALLKAVRAVQNGEMSVHRAGSFYGVPHSTLEYKVKERHLLRRPKRKGANSPKSSHKSSPDSSMSGSDPQPCRLASTTSVGTVDSSHLPLTPDLRESLSRYLNIGQAVNLYPTSSSPDHPGLALRLPTKKPSAEVKTRECRLDNPNLGLGRTISNPFLNLFHLDDLIRHNLDNDSLLDLTKKS